MSVAATTGQTSQSERRRARSLKRNGSYVTRSPSHRGIALAVLALTRRFYILKETHTIVDSEALHTVKPGN